MNINHDYIKTENNYYNLVNKKIYEVVISVTKAGNTLILERNTGRPIFDITYRKAPKSNIEGIGLEEVGIAVDKDKILVNSYYQTNIPGYYAIGDIVLGPALAHVASAEGILCVEKIAGHDVTPIDYGNIPNCTYCSPEISSVGLTEKQSIDKGFDVKIGKFPFSASGKASASGHKDGFVKVIFDSKYGEWLGCHMIGAGVTDMIAEVVLGRKLETTGHDVLKTIHPHPTMSEAIMEAVAQAYDEVIHL